MAMEFQWLSDSDGDTRVALGARDVLAVGHALEDLCARTGIYLDPYGTTRLSPEHAGILLEGLRKRSVERSAVLAGLVSMLEVAMSDGKWIVVEGD